MISARALAPLAVVPSPQVPASLAWATLTGRPAPRPWRCPGDGSAAPLLFMLPCRRSSSSGQSSCLLSLEPKTRSRHLELARPIHPLCFIPKPETVVTSRDRPFRLVVRSTRRGLSASHNYAAAHDCVEFTDRWDQTATAPRRVASLRKNQHHNPSLRRSSDIFHAFVASSLADFGGLRLDISSCSHHHRFRRSFPAGAGLFTHGEERCV